MNCRLINARVIFEWIAVLFFITSGVLCISVYGKTENLFDGLFQSERNILLVVAIVHFVLALVSFVSGAYTTKLLRPYISENDAIYLGLWDLLGLDKRALPVDIEAFEDFHDEGSEHQSYREPVDNDKIKTENDQVVHVIKPVQQHVNEDIVEAANKPPFVFTYKPNQNLPEEMIFKESFASKLGSDCNLENLVLGEDTFPSPFAINIKTTEIEDPTSLQQQPEVEIGCSPAKFVFTYKTKKDVCQNPENLKHNEKFILKLSSNIDLEDIILENQATIEEKLGL